MKQQVFHIPAAADNNGRVHVLKTGSGTLRRTLHTLRGDSASGVFDDGSFFVTFYDGVDVNGFQIWTGLLSNSPAERLFDLDFQNGLVMHVRTQAPNMGTHIVVFE